MFLVQIGIREVPNAVCIALLPHLQSTLFAINAPVWTQSDCETEPLINDSKRTEIRNGILTIGKYTRLTLISKTLTQKNLLLFFLLAEP